VAVAIGKLDAIFFILGIFGGIFLFGMTVPGFTRFNFSGALGSLTLPAWLDLNRGIVVLAVVVLALGAFWVGEKSEGPWNVFGRVYGKQSKGDERP
jgi:hypothetical protein